MHLKAILRLFLSGFDVLPWLSGVLAEPRMGEQGEPAVHWSICILPDAGSPGFQRRVALSFTTCNTLVFQRAAAQRCKSTLFRATSGVQSLVRWAQRRGSSLRGSSRYRIGHFSGASLQELVAGIMNEPFAMMEEAVEIGLSPGLP
ncbi:hypothetical protein BKA70DRAFT_1492306 [Coprinopsis sp. MPI-PUGE-AT-0042]|nr:hypothetical protein BKA70DRAFT_1492306 [Coprinopsis sp. MPI-PUGE-AT-0042]